ncbi:MAG: FAD-dependent oxidoreductase [Proteobacteria bacterium]|nr:FAD-dependent oxidoreductase [Pseudomonadota bacterium]
MKRKIAIIGAGLAGLSAAKKLAQSNEVVIFDKSRGIGGRMTTRRVGEEYSFDHGAQFFTAKSDKFKELCQKALEAGIIDVWQCRFAEIDGTKIARKWQFDQHHPHYVAQPQMNSLCKWLAQDLDVRLKHEINHITFNDGKWSLKTTQNEQFRDFDDLIIAIPSHQCLKLLPQGFKHFQIVENIKMQGCFSLMLGFKEALNLDFDAALVKNSNISWISCNSSKPNRPKGFTILVNSSNEWAQKHLEEDLKLVKSKLIEDLGKIINFDEGQIRHSNIHRWRYANAKLREGELALFDGKLRLGICGDWLIAGRVENAYLSASKLVETISSHSLS